VSHGRHLCKGTAKLCPIPNCLVQSSLGRKRRCHSTTGDIRSRRSVYRFVMSGRPLSENSDALALPWMRTRNLAVVDQSSSRARRPARGVVQPPLVLIGTATTGCRRCENDRRTTGYGLTRSASKPVILSSDGFEDDVAGTVIDINVSMSDERLLRRCRRLLIAGWLR
jgi:hypothetical protein